MSYRRNRAVNSNRSDAAFRPGLAERRYRDTGRAGPVSLERVHDFGHSPALRKALAGTTALTAAAVCGYLLSSDLALALPTDGTVVEGQAEIIYGENSVTIQQGSDRVIIEWQTFDIDVHESVNFIQPHDLAAALNRVLSGETSQILGSLSANGQVFISNPAGVVFGPDANVDVASIVATSLDIMDDRFMAGGRLEFDIAGDPTAVVENRGTINASGLAALVAPGVRNAETGVIVADVAILGGGEGFALDYYGDGLVNFAITDPTTMVPVDSDGNEVEELVSNEGTILADAGQVILTADAAAGVINNIINVEGVIIAHSIENRGGQISLVGGDEGVVTVAGTIDASGVEEDDEGGTVHVLGETVVLADGASIDVSGPAGGGTALVGGALQGGPLAAGGHIAYSQLEPAAGGGTSISIDVTTAFETESYIPTADYTYVEAEAAVAADATVNGDGGMVVVWANEETEFYGTISAVGGAEGGDGGFVEISGAALAFDGAVHTSAILGSTGWLMLDPVGIRVIQGDNQGSHSPGASSIIEITDGTLNNLLDFNNILLATAPSDATVSPVPGNVQNNRGGGANDDNIVVEAGTAVDTGANTLFFSTTTVDLYADIAGNVDGGLNSGAILPADLQPLKDPSTVNVYGTASGGTASIQDGVDIVGVGGTVNVGDGTYEENVVIDQSLALIGDPGDPLVPGAGSPLLQGDGTGFGIEVNPGALDVEISGFAIDNYVDGINADIGGGVPTAGSVIDINNNTITNTTSDGIFVDEFASVTLAYNDITVESGDGVEIEDFDDLTAHVTGNVIGSETSGIVGGNGILIDDEGDATDMSVFIRQNSISGFDEGIDFTSTEADGATIQASIEQNVISGNTVGIQIDGDAVTTAGPEFAVDASDITVFNNDLSGNDTAVEHNGTGLLDASGNYWGSADETVVDASVVVGDDTVASVDFTPFLTSGDDLDDAGRTEFLDTTVGDTTLGFQGDFTEVFVTALGDQAGPVGRIQEGVDLVTNSTVILGAGTFIDPAQVVLSSDITIYGQGPGTTIVMPGFSTGSSGDARGWWLVEDGVEAHLSDFTMDGTDQLVWQAIRHKGSGTIDNMAFENIVFNESGPNYAGTAVAAFGDGPVDITNSTFSNIGRIGAQFFGPGVSGSTFADNTYTGKGVGNWLDYGVEVGGGAADIQILRNTITNNLGVAASDGSVSAGILVTTYFGDGSSAHIENNFINGNSNGVFVGFDEFDTSDVTIFNNDLSGNGLGVVSTAPTVDASGNWWGTNDEGAVLAETDGPVDITPFLNVGTDTDLGTGGFQGDFTVLNVTTLGEQTDPGLDVGTYGAFGAGNELRINEAIQMVSGSTVQVWQGAYVENVLVNLDGLSLLGGFSAPGVQGGTSFITPVAAGAGDAVILVDDGSSSTNDVTIDNFTLVGTGIGFGVLADDVQDFTLSRITAGDTSVAGIRVVVDHDRPIGGSITNIVDNILDGTNTGDGIQVAGDSGGVTGDDDGDDVLIGATVNIERNTIGTGGDDIGGRGIVFTSNIGDDDGSLRTAFNAASEDESFTRILVDDNDVFSVGNALEFSGQVADNGFDNIDIDITDNNDGFHSSAGHGIYYGGPIAGADLDIQGNIVDAALDGIHFAGSVSGSEIDIGGGAPGADNTIDADDSGIVFDDSVLAGNFILINGNTVTAGPSLGDRGIEFRNGISDSFVTLLGNTIHAGDDGVAFYDLNGGANGSGVDAIAGESVVAVILNTIGSAGDPVGREGLDFDEITDTAVVGILGNTIHAARDGMQFDRLIDSTGSATGTPPSGLDYDGAVVIVDNDVSAGRHGALFDTEIAGADVTFGENDWGTDADPVGGDGVQFGEITGDATVSFEREHIDADGDGVSVTGGILDTASLEFREARVPTVPDGRDTDIDAGGIAVNVVNLQSPSTLSYAGGSFTGGAVAVNVDNTGLPGGTAGTVEFSGAPAFDVTDADGTVAQFLTDDTGPGINIDFGTSTASFTGGEDGMVFSGPGIDILGGGAGFSGSLGSISFTGQTDQYVSLTDGAEFDTGTGLPNLIDVTGVTFDGDMPGVLSLVDLVGLESKLFHFLDGPELDGDQNGLFYYGPTLTVTEGNSIQLAVNTVEIIRSAGLAAGQVAVGSGTFGGSVELWVDNLKVTGVDTGGGSPVIDTDTVDPFANQGDLDNGFYIADIGAIGDGSLNAVTSGSAANGNDVENVTIDPFVFAGSGPASLVGSDIGVQLGAAGSTAINAVVDGNAFYDLDYGIVSVNTAGNTRVINNVMRRIAFDGIQFQDGIGFNEVLEILNNGIGAGDHGIALLGAIGRNADVDIHDNRILANQNEDATGAGIYFGSTIGGIATVNIGDGDRYSGTASNIITVAGNSVGADVSGLDGIHFADDVGGEADIVIDGNRIGYTPPATSGGDRAPVADDGIEFHGDVEGAVDVTITDNWIRAEDDGIQFSARVRQNAEVLIGGGSYNYNFISAGDVGILFGGAVRNSAGTESEIEISYNDIYGDDGIVFQGRVSGEGHDTLIANNHNIVGRDGDGIRFDRAIDDAEVRILDNNDGIEATDDGIELAGGLTGTAYVAIARNNIRADEDGVLVDGEGVSDRSHLAIVDNNIGFYTDRIGENGVDIQSVTNRASVWIAYNDIYSYGSAIQFDGPITTRSRYIDWTGFYPGEFGVGIFGNTHINSYYGDGIEFSGPVVGGERSVRILIAENNHGIDAGQHGITFDSLVDNAYIRIAANDIEAGLYDGIGDGIHFGGEIWYSTIDIGSVFEDYGNEIDAYGDGIDFDERVRYSDVYIENNDINYGSGQGERGIEFDNGVFASNVYILDNEILEEDWEWRRNDSGRWYRHYFVGDDGILFNDGEYSGQQSIDGESYVVISGNQIGSEYRPVGQNPDEADGGSGVDIQSVADYSSVEISYNDIYAQDNAVQFDGTVEDSWVDVSWNEHLVGYDRHGVTFEDAVLSSYVNVIGNNHGIWAGQNGINFGALVSDSEIQIAGNRIRAGQAGSYDGDGIHFGGEVWYSEILIGGYVDHWGDWIDFGNHIDANGDGIDFDERVFHSLVFIGNNDIDYGSGQGERGIEFDDGVYASEVYIVENTILEDDWEWRRNRYGQWYKHYFVGDDGILFNAGDYPWQQAIDGESYVLIAGNQIGSEYRPVGQNPDETDGGSGVDIQSVAEYSTVDILYNDIYAADNAVQFDSTVRDSWVNVSWNEHLVGYDRHGVTFEGAVLNSTVDILGNNHGIWAGQNGINFGGVVSWSDIWIADNIIHAGETSPYDGDGIHFDGEIWHSWIGIGGPLPFMGNEIDANGDGIDFDERVRYSTVAIKNNDIDYGTGEGERGIEFDNGVYDSDVYIWWNRILEDDYEYTGDDGILFNAGEYEGQAAIDGDSYVSIYGNQIGSEYLPVGQNSDEDLDGDYNNGGAGIDIDNVSENAYLDITYNWIYGEDYGIQFDGGSPAVEDNAVVRIADNFRVIGFNEDGIQFREDITDNGLVIIRDNRWIRGGDDGIEFNGRILGDATVRILDNRRIIGLDDEGIEFSTIRGNARVVVAGNHLIRGGDNGIDFDGTIRQNAIVRVLDNHRILGLGEDGMEFSSIRGNALVRIARNDLIRGYDTGIDFNGTIRQNAVVRVVNNDRIIGRNDEGIEFSTIRGDARVVIAWNDLIRGYDSGIDFDGRIRDNALIRIADNGRIIGRHENGIEFSRSVGDYSRVRIVRNDLIRGYDNGIEFEAPVQDAANVRIARNEHIVGRYEDGISFNGVFDYETYVRIVNNTLIEGYENGIHFASVPWYGYGLLSGHGLYGADPSIWGAQVAIIDNDEIVGHHRNGILVEGIRGDGAPMDYGVGSRYGLPASLFGYDQAHLEITGNGSITGYTNGVKIARVLNHDIGYGPYGFGGSLSAWAVEDAIVRIALNDTIEGETRNGVLIQGIRSTAFGDGFPGNQVALVDEPGYEEWEPSETIVDIYGNTEILGANNGIKLARGFDLGFGVFGEFDIRTLGAVAALADADGIDGFGDWLFSIDGVYVDLAAWALQDATTRIAHNDLIRGGVPADSGSAVTTAETDDEGLISGNNGILVQGVRNTGYGPIYDDPSLGTAAEEAVDHPSYRGAGSNLEIVANGTIEGYNNGVRLARGLTAEAYLDFGEYYHLSIDAWAIQNASAVIGYNGLISGQNRDGIQVQGVSEGFGRNGGASVSFINGFDNGIDLLIIDNEEISGYDDGIDLQRGLSASLDVFVDPGVLSLSDQLRADPYTPIATPRSGNGTFNLTSMGRMTVDGVEYTVWRLRNETDTDEPATLRAAGGPVVFDGIVPANSDLFVASPVTGGSATHIVSFTDAEVSRTKASDTRDFQYGTSTPPSFDAFLSADAWAIDGAEVEISGNPTITGTDGDGIFVGGVRDQFYSYGEYDNLLITENGLIEGYWDGIRLGRGLSASASLSADIYYDEGDDREVLPVGAGLTQIDLAGDVDAESWGGEWFDDVELDVHSASLNLDIWAIDYATVTISENETIQGLAGDGIFVGGVRDGVTSPEDRDNLTIFSNTDILGGRDGIHFGQGLSFWLSYESEEELEQQVSAASLFSGGFGSGHEGLSYGLTVASIYDANVVIDLNGTAEQLGEVYDPITGDTILVDLDEFTVTGKVSGGDDGIDFAGLIGGDSTVTVSRNMVTESGDNGIEVGQVGDTFIPVPVSFEVDFPFESFGGAPLNGGNTINGQAASSLRNPTGETVTFTAVTETGLTIEVEVPPESWVLVPTAELEGFSNVNWFVDGERVGGGSYLNNVPYVPGEFDVAVLSDPEGPVATLNIFNNFVMDNGLSLEEIDETFAAETAALQSGLGDYRYYDEGTLHGDGIHFEGDISPNGLVQVYQNYLTENAGDGVGVGSDFSSEEPTEPPITSPSFLSFYGDDDGIVDIGEPVVDEEGNPVSGLFININFMPGNGPDGPIDLEFSNGGFGYNQGPDAEGVANLEGNWWGTPLGTDFAINFTQSINGVAPENLPELIVLDPGDDDANITPPFGNTPFEFFAFQPALVGPPVTLADLDAILGFPVDLFTILIDPRGPLSDLSRPGGAQFFTNELGEPFQVTTFSDSFSIGELAGPGGLQPAAGGGTGDEEEEEAEGEGEGQQEGGQQGPVNLGDLQPAAGPGSQQALNEDTCVATFFGDFWNAAAACQ